MDCIFVSCRINHSDLKTSDASESRIIQTKMSESSEPLTSKQVSSGCLSKQEFNIIKTTKKNLRKLMNERVVKLCEWKKTWWRQLRQLPVLHRSDCFNNFSSKLAKSTTTRFGLRSLFVWLEACLNTPKFVTWFDNESACGTFVSRVNFCLNTFFVILND